MCGRKSVRPRMEPKEQSQILLRKGEMCFCKILIE